MSVQKAVYQQFKLVIVQNEPNSGLKNQDVTEIVSPNICKENSETCLECNQLVAQFKLEQVLVDSNSGQVRKLHGVEINKERNATSLSVGFQLEHSSMTQTAELALHAIKPIAQQVVFENGVTVDKTLLNDRHFSQAEMFILISLMVVILYFLGQIGNFLKILAMLITVYESFCIFKDYRHRIISGNYRQNSISQILSILIEVIRDRLANLNSTYQSGHVT